MSKSMSAAIFGRLGEGMLHALNKTSVLPENTAGSTGTEDLYSSIHNIVIIKTQNLCCLIFYISME